jgi:hypothetical protein
VDTVKITYGVNWTPNVNVFQVQLQNPNGQADQNTVNNFGISPFTTPPVLNVDGIMISFQTNKAPGENHYKLTDLTTGVVLSEKNNFQNQLFTYRDTIPTIVGHCYRFEFFDDGPPPSANPLNNDGLNWWANPDDGAGSVRISSNVSILPLKTFQSDFGTKFYWEFMCRFPLGITGTETKDVVMMVYPNPSSDGQFTVDYTLPGKEGKLEVYNMIGAKVTTQVLNSTSGSTQVSLKGMAKGYYLIKVTTPDKLVKTHKVAYQ